MTVVAVTGASSAVGSALCALLGHDPGIEQVIGVDVVEPGMPVAKLDFHVADVRDPVLSRAVADADVLVHLATWIPERVSEDVHFARVVQGTRNALLAAEKAGVGAVVHLSSAMVYGARAQNPVPLSEEAQRRVAPDAVRPYHLLLAEELAANFASRRPDTRVAVLRPATVLGPGMESPAVRFLEAPRIPLVAGYDPTFQVLHVEDCARALHLAVTGTLEGPYNVAADGWVTEEEGASLLSRRPLRIPETPLVAVLDLTRRAGLTDMGPGLVAYLMHPWVVDTTRLKAAGWRADRSHREVLRAFADEHGPWVRAGEVRLRRRDLYAGAAAAGALGAVSAWKAVERRRSERE